MVENVLSFAAIVFFALGSLAVIIGGIGLIRLPDVYARIHAAGMIDTAGVACFILGMMCLFGWSLISFKLLMIGVFIMFTSPVSSHAIAQLAHQQGIKPQGRDLTRKKSTKKTSKKTRQAK